MVAHQLPVYGVSRFMFFNIKARWNFARGKGCRIPNMHLLYGEYFSGMPGAQTLIMPVYFHMLLDILPRKKGNPKLRIVISLVTG